MTGPVAVRGPYLDELQVGQVFDQAPPVTITDGVAAVHHSIVGNRLHLALDADLAAEVTGSPGLVSPALVWDLSIGQSTAVTQKVRANLFYRDLVFHRFPHVGDTLRTVTTVDALRGTSARPDRPRTGLAALHVVTTDQYGRTVLDFWRCAMLPVTPGHRGPLPSDDVAAVGSGRDQLVVPPDSAIVDWDLGRYRARVTGPVRRRPAPGDRYEVDGADVVTSAPELARLTGNVAAVHHDAARAGGTRLVYGGHTVGIAFHQLTRALPALVTVLGWHSCDHLAPVHEGDSLTSTIEVTGLHPAGDAVVVSVRVHTSALRDEERTPVLDWHLSVVLP